MLFGLRISRIRVRVICPCELPITLFYFFLGSVNRDFQKPVIALWVLSGSQ
jgi:hypothetical protein